jgi:hypothetical protein
MTIAVLPDKVAAFLPGGATYVSHRRRIAVNGLS